MDSLTLIPTMQKQSPCLEHAFEMAILSLARKLRPTSKKKTPIDPLQFEVCFMTKRVRRNTRGNFDVPPTVPPASPNLTSPHAFGLNLG